MSPGTYEERTFIYTCRSQISLFGILHNRHLRAAECVRVSSAACPDPVSPGGERYLKVATPMQRVLHVPNKTINEPRLCKSQNAPGGLHIVQYRAEAIGRLNKDPALTE